MTLDIGVFIPGSGNPDTAYEVPSNEVGALSPYAPGDLGKHFLFAGRTYQKVQLDAGVSPTAPDQLIYWKDQEHFVVTNVAPEAPGKGHHREKGKASAAPAVEESAAGTARGVVPPGAQFFIVVNPDAGAN